MKKVIIVFALIVLASVAVYAFTRNAQHEEPIACTEEALMCPDGSGVGRTGPKCTFAPCADHEAFTGIFDSTNGVYRLLMETPDSVFGATYVLSLDMNTIPDPQALLGKRVQVKGHFTEGNTLQVQSIEALTGEAADATLGEVSIGQTIYINGVKITLDDIVQDNRCPADVQCIVKGSVTARVTLKSDTDNDTKDINSDAVPAGFDSYLISIARISPESKSAGKPIAKSEYKIQFKVVPTVSR